MKQQFSKTPATKQKGYILALLCILLGVLFTLAAAAIDLGNMYLWRLRLEKATRAGAIAGLGYRALKGWQGIYGEPPIYQGSSLDQGKKKRKGDSTEIDRLLLNVESVVRENIKGSFTEGRYESLVDQEVANFVTINPLDDAYDPIADTITITASYRVPTFLVGRLAGAGFPLTCPGAIGSRCSVTTTQTAGLRPATIAMILDTSGSMICNIDDLDNCACRNNDSCGTGGKEQSIKKLRDAVVSFQKFFNPFHDRIALIPFNIAAMVKVPIKQNDCTNPGSTQTVNSFGKTKKLYDKFYASIEGKDVDGKKVKWTDSNCAQITDAGGVAKDIPPLEAVSNTNPCDGFLRAIGAVNDVLNDAGDKADNSIPKPIRPFYFFFTDGAPNAMRMIPLNSPVVATGSPPNVTRLAQGLAQGYEGQTVNDWYQYSIEWKDTSFKPEKIYRGPGPLVGASVPLFNFQITSTSGVAVTYPPPPATATKPTTHCGDNWPNEFEFDKAEDFDAYNTATDTKERGCLKPNMEFALPGLPDAKVSGVPFSKTYTINGVSRAVSSIDQMHYFCPIEAADWARYRQGATIYAVGLGQPALQCGDPAQDPDNHFLRKDNFLNRLAFSEASVTNPDVPTTFTARCDFSRANPTKLISCPAGATGLPVHRFKREFNLSSMDFGYTSGIAATEAKPLPAETMGDYYGTTDATEINQIFTQIAKQILLRQNT